MIGIALVQLILDINIVVRKSLILNYNAADTRELLREA